MSVPSNEPAEPVYEDFRQLLALIESRTSSNPGLLRRMKTRAERCLESIAGFLETRAAISVAALLCLGLAGVSWMGIQQREAPQPAVAVPIEQPLIPSVPLEQAPVAIPLPPEQAYVVRVGSFRDPANAARVVNSLRERMSNVRTEESAGLYIVELGPFRQRSEAEGSAQELRRDDGLAPQIIRRK